MNIARSVEKFAAPRARRRGGAQALSASRWPSSDAFAEAGALLRAHRGRLSIGLVLVTINRLSVLVLPAATKWFMDDIVKPQRWDLLPQLVMVLAATMLVLSVTTFSLSQIVGVAGERVVTDLRKQVQAHVMRLPVRYFDTAKTGVLLSRIMSDTDGLRTFVGNGLVQMIGSSLMGLMAFGVLLYLNWALTAAMVLVLGIFGSAITLTAKRLTPIYLDRAHIVAEMTGRLSETLGGIRVIKSYAAEKREALVFARDSSRLFRNVVRGLAITSAMSAYSTLMIGVAAVVLMVFGGHSLRYGTMTIGELTMYASFMAVMTIPLTQVPAIGAQLSEGFAALERTGALRRVVRETDVDDSRMPMPDVHGNIEFSDVSFEYRPGVPVLKHISFSAPTGATIALVGASGAGKSTLISLVMAFNAPTSGSVRIDGRELSSVCLADYRQHLGLVLQDDVLFEGTIADNIAYGSPHASREAIIDAARVAHCDEFVQAFVHGYDTVIGERGVRLSGGQRQRLSIARAILANPKILVLDEATSSLDSVSEALLQDALETLRRGRTTFVIAHRLSTIRTAAQILVLEHGEIIERGTHEELLARRGRYRQLHDSQYRFEQEGVPSRSGV
jgi:subfamily B ATP-binding cassette protein MsbA